MSRGLTLESNTLKVLKALAELENVSTGELLERIVLCAFEGKVAFSGEALAPIQKLKAIYGLTSSAEESAGASRIAKE
jgi:hypothetical protein